jgi:hypothetical protein
VGGCVAMAGGFAGGGGFIGQCSADGACLQCVQGRECIRAFWFRLSRVHVQKQAKPSSIRNLLPAIRVRFVLQSLVQKVIWL